ncbi:hypothetical protein [Streptomyces sp. NPDC001889]
MNERLFDRMTAPLDDGALHEVADVALAVLTDRCPRAARSLPRDPATVLIPVVEAVLGQAAGQRWIDRRLAETALRSADFRNGTAMEIAPAHEMAAHWVAAARAMLGDAPNYAETPVKMDIGTAGSPERFVFTLQRAGRSTPHEARAEAERQRDDVLRIVADAAARPDTTVNAADLAARLARAGHSTAGLEHARTDSGPFLSPAADDRTRHARGPLHPQDSGATPSTPIGAPAEAPAMGVPDSGPGPQSPAAVPAGIPGGTEAAQAERCDRCGEPGFLARDNDHPGRPALCVGCHEKAGTSQAEAGHTCDDGCALATGHDGLCHPVRCPPQPTTPKNSPSPEPASPAALLTGKTS